MDCVNPHGAKNVPIPSNKGHRVSPPFVESRLKVPPQSVTPDLIMPNKFNPNINNTIPMTMLRTVVIVGEILNAEPRSLKQERIHPIYRGETSTVVY